MEHCSTWNNSTMGWFDDAVDDLFGGDNNVGGWFSDVGSAVKGYFTGETASTINTAAGLRTMAQQNEYNTALQNDAQYFNAQEAQKARDFEKSMSNTAYQRVVKDLRAAGLNPLLAATSLGGASTPSGSAASSGGQSSVSLGISGGAQAGSLSGILSSAASLTSGLGGIAKLGNELKNQVLQNDLIKAQTAKTVQDTLKAKKETDSINSDARYEKDRFGNDWVSQIGSTLFTGLKSAVPSWFKDDKSKVIDNTSDLTTSAKGVKDDVESTLKAIEGNTEKFTDQNGVEHEFRHSPLSGRRRLKMRIRAY